MRPPQRSSVKSVNEYAEVDKTKKKPKKKPESVTKKPLKRIVSKPHNVIESASKSAGSRPPAIAYEDVLDEHQDQQPPSNLNLQSSESYHVLHHQESQKQLLLQKSTPMQPQPSPNIYNMVEGSDQMYDRICDGQSSSRAPYDKVHADPPPYQLPADAIRIGQQQGILASPPFPNVPEETFGSQETLLESDYQQPEDAIGRIRSDTIRHKPLCYVCTEMHKEECAGETGSPLQAQPGFTSTKTMRVEGRCTCRFDSAPSTKVPPYYNIVGTVRGEPAEQTEIEPDVTNIPQPRPATEPRRKSKDKIRTPATN